MLGKNQHGGQNPEQASSENFLHATGQPIPQERNKYKGENKPESWKRPRRPNKTRKEEKDLEKTLTAGNRQNQKIKGDLMENGKQSFPQIINSTRPC